MDEGGYERKIERKTINFFNLAIRILITLSYGKDEAHLLERDQCAFAGVVGLAHGLYALFRQFDAKWRKEGLGALENIESITYGSLRLSSLIPGAYRVKEIFKGGKVLSKRSFT